MAVDSPIRDFVIPFALDEISVHAVPPLVYRPWGTRTIKLRATTRVELPALWIRPQCVLPEDSALGIYQAYADDSRALRVTWGGGHEIGPCVRARDVLSAFETAAPLPANHASYLFFNLTHVGTQMPTTASLTLRAFACRQNNGHAVEQDQARLILPIRPPNQLPPPDDIMHVVPGEHDRTWVVSPGHFLPVYDSRWWPAPEVVYEASESPPLMLRIDEGALWIDWREPGHTVAIIEDYTQPSVLRLAETLAFELFAFDPWSVVLRVWFFWVDKYIGGEFFVGRHEVPDAERFDMIIRRTDGRVLLAGTDLHWREVWARVLPTKILRATLGVPRETAIQLAREKWRETWQSIWARPPNRAQLETGYDGPHNPMEPYIRRLAEREATVTLKAGGTEAHVPTLHNVEQRRPSVMTSSDVRLG